ncbi:MAG TPA: tRNA (adenosine(37)-N6)-dimethylallyltransferase MiaA [Stellaceae bacterium]|nr:tRNA (adenosine(37)-N6)-dimethylallyltransferase MiaA [Stellaceae bacterium]
MARNDVPLVLIAGPTASGKSALALDLAGALQGTVINADSMQVYRDLRVLTARPGPDAERRAPHRLYGVIDAAEPCSVGRWRALAMAAIAEARQAGRIPILAGGTGLYIHALVHGLAAVPPIPDTVREEARALHRRLGPVAFHAALAERDPEAAARLASGDRQRLIRAFEVLAATGRTLGAWQRESMPSGTLFAMAAITLLPPRAAHYALCDARFIAMMEQGAPDEVAALVARGLSPGLPVMKAVGVREIAAWLAGRVGRDEAVAAAQQATRRYVKRQTTWLRHRMTDLQPMILTAQYSESLLPEILAFIRRTCLTTSD